MNAITQINDTQVSIINFKSVPVATTEMLADFYGTESIRIQQNHSRNADRFVENKHFFKLVGDELRQFKKSLTSFELVSQNAKHLILWTERGAARHAKMLDTEQAWEVFEQLEDCYFNAVVSNPNDKITSEQAGILSTIVRTRCEGNGKLSPQMWSRLKNHFKYAASYREIKAVDFDEACQYLEEMQLKVELPVQQALPLLPIPFQQGKYIVTVDADGTVKIQDASKYQIVDMEAARTMTAEAHTLLLEMFEFNSRLKEFQDKLTTPKSECKFIGMLQRGEVLESS